METNAFVLRRTDGISYYACVPLERHPFFIHGFSTRHGGVSLPPAQQLNLGLVPWDSPANVEENRRRFLSALNIGPRSLITLTQTHSSDYHIVTTGAADWDSRTPGDALLTARAQVALAVKTADCFPVLVSDVRTGSIAAVHAGWRGTLIRILSKTLEGMRQEFGTAPRDLIVAIGPGIRHCCLEVSADVAGLFRDTFPAVPLLAPHPDRPAKFMLDLPLALKHQLTCAGVPDSNVYDLGLCTRCRTDEFFSHRAEGNRSGRLLSVIYRRDR